MTDAPPALVDEVRCWLAERSLAPTARNVGDALRALPGVRSASAGLRTVDAMRAELSGAGPLQAFIDDPEVTDVLVHAGGQVWVDRGRGLAPAGVRIADETTTRALAVRIVSAAGRRLDAAHPYADAMLPGGHRVHAVLPPVSVDGTCLSIRALRPRRHDLDTVLASSAPQFGRCVRAIVDTGVAAVISGATGAGKTTLLGAMLGTVPPTARIVTVEDTAELRPDHPQVVRLQARTANLEGAGAIELRALVRQALRMRPDRIVLGEIRGAEAIDLLVALNTGHTGGLCTMHANAAAEVPARFEALMALGGIGQVAAHSLLAPAIRVVVHLERTRIGRSVGCIGVLSAGTDGLVECVPGFSSTAGVDAERGPAYPALAELLGW